MSRTATEARAEALLAQMFAAIDREPSTTVMGYCDDARDVCDQTTRLCTSRIAVGGACSTIDGCVAYATCDGTTCVAMPGPGASCDSIAQDPCLLNLSCDTTTMHCSLPPSSASCR